ncbi:biopolymer transporter Tol [Arthrobacter sp.]|uniref:TolB family protein n=1 Tax=Arthrobacter sp. TaxID=1667 RepID=UPI0025886FEF|nr:biopolymer transporter Tol [Arthrobacter sp.]
MTRELLPGQRAELLIVDVDSAAAVLRYSTDALLIEAPNWSPDGRTLIVNGAGRLFCLGAETGGLDEVDLGGIAGINNDHVLGPDGSTAYVSSDDGHIYAVKLDGSGRPRRVSNDNGEGFRHYLHGVSPDGTTLAYIGLASAGGTVRTNVYLLPSAGGADIQLTDDRFPDDGAEFSPDGRWVYFNSERASSTPGHAQLFRMPAPPGVGGHAGPEQLTFDERVNWFPHPSPDGTRVAYVSFPPGTLGHPENVEVLVRLREADGTIRDLARVLGGQGTMNVPSWDPTGRNIAIVAYPLEAQPSGPPR